MYLKKLILSFIAMSLIIFKAYPSAINEKFKEISSLKDPFALRDPFLAPKFQKEEEKKSTTPMKDGVYTNIPVLGDVELDKFQITGVIIGPERRAFLNKDGDKDKTYVLKEGMKLGPNKAEVKAILPGGIILVEKVTNIYGEEEFLETVIPLSK